jgi:hypothetical protein
MQVARPAAQLVRRSTCAADRRTAAGLLAPASGTLPRPPAPLKRNHSDVATIDAQKGKTQKRLDGKLPRTVRRLPKTQLALLCDQEAAILAKAETLTGTQALAQADDTSESAEEDSAPAGPLFDRGKALPAGRA